MKKFFSIFLILFVCKLFTGAQTPNESEWKTYSPALEQFIVTAPSNFDLVRSDKKDNDATRIYRSVLDGTYLFIASSKNSDSSPYKSIVSLATTNKAVKKNLKIDSRAAEEFDFSDSEGFYQKVIAVKTDSRFYVFYSVSEKENAADGKKFFNSIKFDKTKAANDQSATDQTKTETPVKVPTKTADVPVGVPNSVIGSGNGTGNGVGAGGGIGNGSGNGAGNGAGSGSGSGNGLGNGAGNGSGSGSGNSNPTKPVRILSKQQAKYTDLARIFGIEGSVLLRVTFSANGTIGSIVSVKKLPFGLTASAISAAKNVRFEPATKNGVAISVSKSVQFSFKIY